MAFTHILLLYRCSLLEPGLVGTSVMQSMGAWVKNYDMLAADQKSLELKETLGGKMQGLFGTIQGPNELAEIVKKIILSDKPNLRYQSNANFNPDEVKATLVDPTGNDVVQMLKRKYLDKE